MIKIAFVIDTIESPTAGTEKQLLMLIKNLDRTKFQPYLCVLRSSKWLREEFDLCDIFEADIYSFKDISIFTKFYRFCRFFREERIDIVQTYFRDGNIAGVLSARFAGIKTILGTRRNQGYWHTALELKIQKFLNRWTTCFLANSENTKAFVNRIEGIPVEKIHVIYNGIEIEAIRDVAENVRFEMRNKFGIPFEVTVVGIVANLRPIKGVDVFLRAAAIVDKQLPEVRFVIVGEGDERKKLESIAEQLGIFEIVKFVGRRTDIPRVLRLFDVGVLSSHSESFSNAVVEYLARGLPVVCTDVGGIRECIINGLNGIIVPAGDHEAIAQGILETVTWQLNGYVDECSKFIEEKFSLAGIINEYEKYYLSYSKHDRI